MDKSTRVPGIIVYAGKETVFEKIFNFPDIHWKYIKMKLLLMSQKGKSQQLN